LNPVNLPDAGIEQELSKHLDLVQPAQWKNQNQGGALSGPCAGESGEKILRPTSTEPNRAQLDGLSGKMKIGIGRRKSNWRLCRERR
jgi:hypothetical protein